MAVRAARSVRELTETSSSASLIKAGAGLLSLTANNGYSGSTTVNGGTLQLGNGSNSEPGRPHRRQLRRNTRV